MISWMDTFPCLASIASRQRSSTCRMPCSESRQTPSLGCLNQVSSSTPDLVHRKISLSATAGLNTSATSRNELGKKPAPGCETRGNLRTQDQFVAKPWVGRRSGTSSKSNPLDPDWTWSTPHAPITPCRILPQSRPSGVPREHRGFISTDLPEAQTSLLARNLSLLPLLAAWRVGSMLVGYPWLFCPS